MRDDMVAAPDHRLHNSGPAAREVFRCARVGTDSGLDLLAALAGAECLEDELPALRKALPRRGARLASGRDIVRIPPDTLIAVTTALLGPLGCPPEDPGTGTGAERATALVRQLVREVVGRGWHRPLIGLATATQENRSGWLPGGEIGPAPRPPEDVATTLAAFAVFSPPILLWSRPATLDWLRLDVVLAVRPLWAAPAEAS